MRRCAVLARRLATQSRPNATELVDVFAGGNAPATALTGYSDDGWAVNGVGLLGTALLLPHTALALDIASMDELTTPGVLRALWLYTPAIELVLLGTGPRAMPVSSELRECFARKRVRVEPMASRAAGSTFSFLSQEVCSFLLSIYYLFIYLLYIYRFLFLYFVLVEGFFVLLYCLFCFFLLQFLI